MSTPSASEESLAFRLSDLQLDEIMRLCQPLALTDATAAHVAEPFFPLR
jgi:hypothetical protein